MNKNEFAKADDHAKKKPAWIIAGMTALTVGATIVGPEVIDEIQVETGNNEPRSSVKAKKNASGLTKIGNILFDSRSAEAAAISDVTDANDGNHKHVVTQDKVDSEFVTSNGATNGIGSYGGSTRAVFTTLTAGNASGEKGGLAFNKQVDMRGNWTIKFNLNMARYNTEAPAGILTSPRGAGDSLGMLLAPVTPTEIGTQGATGGGLGIDGIKNATFWGFDLYNNTDMGDVTFNNAGDYSLLSNNDGQHAVGFRETDGTGKLLAASADDDSAVFDYEGKTSGNNVVAATSLLGAQNTGSDMTSAKWDSNTDPNIEVPVTAAYTYDPSSGKGTLKITTNGTYTATRVFDITSTNEIMSLGFKASDGGQFSQLGVTVTNFDLFLPTGETTINYKDTAGNVIKDATKISTNSGDTLQIVKSGGDTAPTSTAHTFDAPAISGYTYLSSTYGTAAGTTSLTVSNTDADNVINLQYAKNSKLTTVFVDQNGKVISTVPSVELGTAGTNYDGQKGTDAADYSEYTAALEAATKVGYTGAVSDVYSDSGLTTKLGADLSSATFGSSDKTVYVQLTPAAQTATISYTQPDGLRRRKDGAFNSY